MENLKVGLQLYSVRDEMAQDMDVTLAKVKEIGYDYVEFAGFFSKTAKDIKSLLNKHQLIAVSAHQAPEVFEKVPDCYIDYFKTLGIKFCAIPWMGIEKHAGQGQFDETVEYITKIGKLLKKNSIDLLYHNHEFEFGVFEGKFLLDWLYESISKEYLKTQLDTCWINYGGQDPAAYITKYADRAPIVHLKDFVCKGKSCEPVYSLVDEKGGDIKQKTREDNEFDFRPLGQGIQDFKSIIDACKRANTEYVIVEQDRSTTCTPMEAAKQSREYLKTLGL